MTDCLFCKIAAKELDAALVYEDENIIAFHDIQPQAPYHILIIPRKHIATMNDITSEDSLLLSQLLLTAKQLAKQFALDEPGYRVLINCNQAGGQAVYHLHLHLLGGRQMHWPPG